ANPAVRISRLRSVAVPGHGVTPIEGEPAVNRRLGDQREIWRDATRCEHIALEQRILDAVIVRALASGNAISHVPLESDGVALDVVRLNRLEIPIDERDIRGDIIAMPDAAAGERPL